MLHTIRKHPLAFLHCLAWLVLGACMAYVMRYETAGYYEAMFASVCVVASAICLALIPLTMLLGIILKAVRKQPYSVRKEKGFLSHAARQFEKSRPGFGGYSLLALVAALLPILALFSVTIIDTYVAAALFAAIGISIWLCFMLSCWSEARLLQARDTAGRFHIQAACAESLPDELCRTGDVRGIPAELWEGRRDHLYNMLLKLGAVSESSTVTGYRFSAAEAAALCGAEPDGIPEGEAVWIPLAPLLRTADSRGAGVVRTLFVYSMDHFADMRYETLDNLLPEEYPYHSRDIRLNPDASAILRNSRRGLRLLARTAEEADPEGESLYQGCMLLLEGAQPVDVKWDHFEDLSPEADREYFLSPEEMQLFYRLLLEGAFAYEICSLTYPEDGRQIALEIWTEPEEISGKRVAYEAQRFVMDDGLHYLLLLRCDGMKWHWRNRRDLY